MPFFGICLGMQMAVIEFARNVGGLEGANSTEFDPSAAVPGRRPDARAAQRHREGRDDAARRLPVRARRRARRPPPPTAPREISERHRHRYEVNNDYREALTGHGMLLSGASPDGRLVEMIELPQHPYFVGCQFHPEFKSRPQAPHPLFQSFIAAALRARLGDRRRRSGRGRRAAPTVSSKSPL